MQEATPENLPPPAADAKVGSDGTAAETSRAIQADQTASATPPDSMPSPEELLRAAELKAAESHDAWLRAKAETENLRRRAQDDVGKAHKYAAEKFAGELLAVKDSLEAALADERQDAAALKAGVELTLKQLVAAFEKAAVKELNPLGEKFDPHFHQAIAMVDVAGAEQEANTVVTVLQKGYALHDRILRPALVTVAKPKS